MTTQDLKNIVLGCWDGDVSITGLVFALVHQKPHIIFIGGLGAAIAACLSMGTGEYESDEGNLRQGLTLGGATLVGTLIPILPFAFLGKTAAIVTGLVLSYLLATAVGLLHRHGVVGAVRTYGVFTVVVLLTVFISVLSPGSTA